MWDFLGSGIEPVSPALEGGFLSTVPPGKSTIPILKKSFRGRTMESSCCVWSLQPHGRQHSRLPCPSPSPGVCSNSCPLSRWCHLTISSSVAHFFFCLQSFPASGSFPMSQLFPSSGQSIGALASSSSPFNEYSGLISLRIDWFDLLAVQETLKSLLQHHNSKASVLRCSAFFMVQLLHL